MAVVVLDTFTGSAGTNLTAHTGETGATWTKVSGVGAGDLALTDVNRVRGNSDDVTYYYLASGTPASDEYDVEADWTLITNVADAFPFIVGRADGAVETYYGVTHDNQNDWWGLYKVIASVQTILASYSAVVTGSTTYHPKLQIRNSLKTMYLDAVDRGSSADNAITATGKSGLAGYYVSPHPTNTTGWQYDTFTVTDLSGSASVSPSLSPSVSPSASKSPSASASPSVSPSASASPSSSASPSKSPSASVSLSVSPSSSISASPSPSIAVATRRIFPGQCG